MNHSLGQLPGVRHTSLNSELFLGGNFVEIGIRSNGKFGTDGKPSTFYGRQPGLTGIGMTGDADGFRVGTDLRIDYFLPGSPEEGFYFGFSVDGSRFEAKNSATSVVDTSFTGLASARVFAQLTAGGGSLSVTQDISLRQDDKLFKNEVTLENTGTISISEVRFMRSHDPDNTVDYSGDFITTNVIVRSMPDGDSISAVSATSKFGDRYYVAAGNKESVILYTTTDPRGRVSYGDFGLAPDYGLYDPNVWTTPKANGTSNLKDVYISVAFDVGTLAPGESTKMIYYTVLDNSDIGKILNDLACLADIPNCIECDQVECITCSAGYYLEANACFPCPGTGCSACTSTECSECFNGFFIDGTTCNDCSTRFEDCVLCTPSECLDCNVGYGPDISGECTECYNTFDNCLDCSSTECTSCDFGYLPNGGVCSPCSDVYANCVECSSATSCSLCADTFFTYYGFCYSCSTYFGPCDKCDATIGCYDCAIGFYSDGGYCYSCSSNCLECSGPAECITCDEGYFLDGTNCTPCLDNCNKCTSLGCTECDIGFNLFVGNCIDCPATFANCIDCTSTACTHCSSNYHLENGQCVADTVFGYDNFSQYNFVEESTYSDSFDDSSELSIMIMPDFFASPNSNNLKEADNSDPSIESCSDILATCLLMSVAILFFIM